MKSFKKVWKTQHVGTEVLWQSKGPSKMFSPALGRGVTVLLQPALPAGPGQCWARDPPRTDPDCLQVGF